MKTIVALLFASFSLASHATMEVAINPLFTYGNYQRFDEIINLSASSPDAVEVNENSAEGYDLLSTRKIFASLGVQAVSSVELPTGMFGYVGLGLYPSYNSYTKQSRRLKNRAALRSLKLEIPRGRETLTELGTGDAAYWNSQGGITMILSLGTGVLGAGPKVSIEGGHSIYVEKKSEQEVYVEVRRLSTKNWGLVAGALITYAEAGKLIENSIGFSFLIDISSEEGLQLYENLIQNGRVDQLQESSRVRAKIGDVSALKVLSSGKAALAIPFVPVLELKKEVGTEVVTEERSDIWGRQSSIVRALSFRARSTRVFKKQTTMETAALVSDEIRDSIRSSRSQLHWFRKGNRFKINRLSFALEKLKKQTGMARELEIVFPAGSTHIGYAKVEFTLSLSPVLEEAIAQRASLSNPKSRAKLLQAYWNGPIAFQKLMSYVKVCGGSWQLEIAGEKVKRLVKGESFEVPTSCELPE